MSTMTTGSPAAHHTPSGSKRGPSTMRKVASLLAIAAGVVLLGSVILNNLFAVGPAFEDMIDDFRPVLTQESIDTAKSDVASLGAVSEEFSGSMAPAVAEQLGMTPEEFSAMVSEEFPAVDEGMTAIPEVATTFEGLLTTLETQQPLFESADAIPTQDLPATTVPWMMLIAGLLSIGVGILIWFSAKAGAVLAIVLGAALIVVPLLLSLPQKAADADQLNENLQPVYTQELVDQANASLANMGAMGEEMQSTMMPALAEQLGMTPEELQAFLGDNFPAVAGALQNLPDTMARFQSLVTVFDENLDNYQTINDVAFVPIIWTLIGAGGVVLLAGLLAVGGKGRKVESA